MRMDSGHIISPREVFNEIKEKDDDIFEWARLRVGCFVDPVPDVQGMVDGIYSSFRNPAGRNKGDPWVIAEATARGLTVVTYEGRTFSGVPTKTLGSFDARNLPTPWGALHHAARSAATAWRIVLVDSAGRFWLCSRLG